MTDDVPSSTTEVQPAPGLKPMMPALVFIGLWWLAALALIAGAGDGEAPALSVPAVIGVSLLVTLALAGAAWRIANLGRQLDAARAELARLVKVDALTGTLNYTAFVEELAIEVERSHRYGQPLALMWLDIDFFRRINDGYGRSVGDAALQAFATTIGGKLRNLDRLGRVGGAEFAILLPNTRAEAALGLAERLREAVATIAVASADGEQVRFTASVGLTETTDGTDSVETTMARAGAARDDAKAAGRNQVVVRQP